jgi:putative oxidoreductase
MNEGLLLLRLVFGLTMSAHGVQKFFGWFGGPGLKKTAQGFEQLGFLPGWRSALMAASAETLSGLLLALGFFTPLGAALLLSVMIVAGLSMHAPKGFFIQGGGAEYNVVLGVGAWALAFTGPGSYSVDSVLGLDFSGFSWGMGALLFAILGAIPELLLRKKPKPQSPA